MKRILITATFAVLTAGLLYGQQDAHYTNFMFNKLLYNPAYAGSREAASLTVLYRKQWVDFPGAPNDQILSFHTPLFRRRVGLGLSLERDAIGFSENYRANMAYSYRIPVSKTGTLSIGLHGTLWANQMNWEEARASDIGDYQIPVGNANKFLANVGAGAYFANQKWYAGVSMPHILKSNMDYVGSGGDVVQSTLRQHLYAMGGLVIPINRNVKFTPNLLLKYVNNAPFDFDLNASFLFMNKLTAGVTYRLGDSVDGLVHYYITPQFRVGVGYDFALTKLQQYNKGSFEVMLGYDFRNIAKEKLQNPRFFF